MQIKNNNKWIVLILLSVFILILGFFIRNNAKENLHIVANQSVIVLEDWIIDTGELVQKAHQLPIDLGLEKGEVYVARTALPYVEDYESYLLIRSSMQDVTVYLEQEEIYTYYEPKSRNLKKPLASVWLMVRLPRDFQGKELSLVLKSEVAAFSGVINEVRLGEASALLYQVFSHSFSGFAVFIVLFSMGMVLSIIAIFMRNLEDNRFLYLGLFAIATSFWILSEARILQFFTGNRYIIGGISYLMVPFMGIFLALYAKEAIFIEKKNKWLMQIIAYIYTALLITTMFLQTLDIVTFIEFMPITLMVIFFNAIIFTRILYKELITQKNKNAKQFFKYISILIISIWLEGSVFYSEQFIYTSFFLRLGIFIFFCLLLVDSYRHLSRTLGNKKEKIFLEELAYKDFLTGAYNRAAFAKDVECFMNKQGCSFRLILLDLNELKYINDQHGHGYGDEAIKMVYGSMEHVFSPFGTCYRIGGDEFAILLENTGKELFSLLLKQFRAQIAEKDNSVPYPFDVAVGSDIYREAVWVDYTSFYHHVDQKMYSDKADRKSRRKK
jgi:diguanylate cyclase (GGDEF)-like protein